MTTRRNFLKSAAFSATAASLLGSGHTSENSDSSASKQSQHKPVDHRQLGRTGKSVSILGLGLGSAFTKPYGKDPEAAADLLETALKHGINYWDTARGYANSEDLIGPVVAQRRKDIYLVTKSDARDYDGFMRDFETSLKKLRTDHIDLLHIWNLKKNENLIAIENGAFKAIKNLQNQKVISHFGITGHSGAAVQVAAIKRFDPDCILTVLPCTRDDKGRYEDEVLPLARERNMGVIAMKTVRRARNADLTGTDLIRYALSLDGVHTTIVGLDTMAHLKDNIAMATDFKPLLAQQRAAMTKDVCAALDADGIPTPWEQPGYQDGIPS